MSKLKLVSLHPIAAFSYAFREIGRLEDTAGGLSFNTMDSTEYESGYTFAVVLQCLLMDSIVWGIVTWYLNRAIPPTYGQALPIYFPFLPSYWFPSMEKSNASFENCTGSELCDESIPVEEVSEAIRMQGREGKSLEILSLKKSFGDKTAVDGLSLSMYSGQITALLGHNGRCQLDGLKSSICSTSFRNEIDVRSLRQALERPQP